VLVALQQQGAGPAGHAAQQGLDLPARGLRVGPSVPPLELLAPAALAASQGPRASQRRVVEAVEEVRPCAGEVVEVERPVLAQLVAPQPVEHERLVGCSGRGAVVLEEQAVSAEPPGLVEDGGVGAAEHVGDLAVAGAGAELTQDGGLQLGALEPVGRAEGLDREGAAAVQASEALDAVGRGPAGV
jgi:hypothetical protein